MFRLLVEELASYGAEDGGNRVGRCLLGEVEPPASWNTYPLNDSAETSTFKQPNW